MAEQKWTIHIERHIPVTQEDIDDIMAGALEGGINYWCSEAEVVGDYLGEYASDQISRGGMLRLHDIETDEVYELTLDKFLQGIKKWAEEDDRYGAVSNKGINCMMIDAIDYDLIVQYALFGEIIFG